MFNIFIYLLNMNVHAHATENYKFWRATIYIYICYITHTHIEREHYTVYEYWRVQSYLLKHSISVKQNVFSAK